MGAKVRKSLAASVSLAIVVSGCATVPGGTIEQYVAADPICGSERRSLTEFQSQFARNIVAGALAGAAVGAIVGAATGRGAAEGALAGALTGAALGYLTELQRQNAQGQAVADVLASAGEQIAEENARIEGAKLALDSLITCRRQEAEGYRAQYEADALALVDAQAGLAVARMKFDIDLQRADKILMDMNARGAEFENVVYGAGGALPTIELVDRAEAVEETGAAVITGDRRVWRSQGGVNLRGGPGTTFPVVGGLTVNQTVVSIGQDGDWLILEDGSYVFAPLMTDLGLESEFTLTAPLPEGAMVVDQTVNLRAGPGTTFDIVGSASPGEPIEVVGEDGQWSRVSIGGQIAYIFTPLLKAQTTSTPPRPEPITDTSGFVVRRDEPQQRDDVGVVLEVKEDDDAGQAELMAYTDAATTNVLRRKEFEQSIMVARAEQETLFTISRGPLKEQPRYARSQP
ncbi:MAG: SH3 domain-containing protein [Maricaulaceae bacterium]